MMPSDDPNQESYDVPVDIQQLTSKQAESKINSSSFLELQLFKAAMKRDVNAFERILEEALKDDVVFSNIHQYGDGGASRKGNSLIHVAAKFGSGSIVRVIAEKLPLLLTRRNFDEDTVLHIAVRAEDESVFNDVLHQIHYYRFQQDVVSSLTVTNKKGNTALHEALVHRRKRMAERLMFHVDQDVFFSTNNDRKSAVYLSVEAGYLDCVQHMLKDAVDNEETYSKLNEGKSVIHVAAEGKHTEISSFMLSKLPGLVEFKDEEQRSPLHVAAAVGALPIVRCLFKYTRNGFGANNELDGNGMMPIHYAAMNNWVNVMKELLELYHDPCELVTENGKNILHVAAEFGRYEAVRYILQTPELKMLLNEMDYYGNTPLHLASSNCHPRIISALTWDDDGVKVDAKNREGQSARDVLGSSGSASDQLFKKFLTLAALKAAKTPKFIKDTQNNEPSNTIKDNINNLLLVSTLVVTVTFAAGFTMPGAYNSSDAKDGPGMAVNLKYRSFQVFVICNTIAMYSAMLVVVVLMWAQLGDIRIMRACLKLALPLLGTALTMMCVAFMTGVYVTVSSLKWIAVFILIFGCSFLTAIATLSYLFGFPADSSKRWIRFATHYFIFVMLWITGNITEQWRIQESREGWADYK